MSLTDLQKEAREKAHKEYDMTESDAVWLDELVARVYHTAIEDAKKAMPEEVAECSSFHKGDGFAWTPCGLCGLRRDENPKRDGMDFEHAGWNAYRTQALTNLDALTNVEPV